MRYFAFEKATDEEREISREEAKKYVARDYTERVCSFDEMLSHEGTIPCMFRYIIVKAE